MVAPITPTLAELARAVLAALDPEQALAFQRYVQELLDLLDAL